jgi:hypothetical protein
MFSTTTYHSPHRYSQAGQSTNAFFIFAVGLLSAGVFLMLVWGGKAGVIRLLFPGVMTLLGAILYFYAPIAYLHFNWWLWFLTPFLRRVVDLQAGWQDPNVMLLAPYLVGALTVFTVLRHLNRARSAFLFPFVVAMVGTLAGYMVGVVRVGLVAATYSLLQWLVPLLMGFHLSVCWRHYPQFRTAFRQAFVWGTLVVAAYALIQYFFLPEWDAYWVIQSELESVGNPEPLEVRVFSTLNSPAPYGHMMMAGLLVMLSGWNLVNLLAAIPGFAGFLLSLSRQSWGAWVLGVLVMAFMSEGRTRRRLITTVAVCALLGAPLLTVDAISSKIGDRASTLTDLSGDASLDARVATYSGVTLRVLNDPLGYGMGFTGTAQKVGGGQTRNFDSGLLDIFLSLGWVGGFLYATGMFMVVWPRLRRRDLSGDPFGTIALAIGIALIALLVFAKSQTGLSGMIMWSFFGVSMAAVQYNQHRLMEEAPEAAPEEAEDVSSPVV